MVGGWGVGWMGWGGGVGSVYCVVTLRSRPLYRHPNHPCACLGFSRLFRTSFAYNNDFVFWVVRWGWGWGWGRGGVLLLRGDPNVKTFP